ncbi:MAG: Crp/Fnr family transcriptional regulator [Alphaproteobacteria bacterium]
MNPDAATTIDDNASSFRLDDVELLAGLTGAERESLATRCRWRRWAPRQLVLDRGSDSREICFIVAGAVRVVNYSASGREVSFADIAAGGTVGELAAIDGEPRSASVFSLDNTLIASLGAGPFKQMVASHPEVAFRIMQSLARMVRRADQRIMDLSTLGAHNRVHGEILRLACENMREDGVVLIRPAPVHADIAARVGTARETVARVMGDLARDKIVDRRAGALAILEFGRLATLVEDVRSK